MDQTVQNVCKSLDGLSSKILNGWSGDKTFTEAWGWNCVPITRQELAEIPSSISRTLRELNPVHIDEAFIKVLEDVPTKITLLENNTANYLYNGHNTQAVSAILGFIQWLQVTLLPLTGWTIMADAKAMPAQLSKRLRSIQAQLTEIIPDKQTIENQIQAINEATAAAESLPTDLQSLKEARKKIEQLHTDSAGLFGKIDTLFQAASANSKTIDQKKEEAEKLIAQCEEAYKITTTRGLAGAFEQRAKALNISMWLWVLGLLLALTIGAWIGAGRVDQLSEALRDKDPNMLIVWTNLVLSIFSIGAPIWFAWIATKQLAQRFKLAEDYSFKASVAKAYEGYRREAARIDPAFEARLFNSALTRLEEAPLRVMEPNNYGSPWHELFESSEFLTAIKEVPALKSKVASIVRRNISKTQEEANGKG